MKRLFFAVLLVPTLSFAQAATPAPAAEPKPVAAEPKAAAAEPKPAAEPAAANTLEIADAKVGTAIEDREVTGAAESFPANVGKIWFWTKVTGGEGQKITHVYYLGDTKMSEIPLDLRFASVRTYSYKTITPEMTGAWKVDVVGPDGNVLKTVNFKVE